MPANKNYINNAKKRKKKRTFSYLFGVMANRKSHSIAHCCGISGAVLTIFVEFLDQGRVVGLWKMGLLIQQRKNAVPLKQ